MCRSCDQTPDGAGRRCPNREDGFTPHESDQRTRSRGLNAAQNALSQLAPGQDNAASNQAAATDAANAIARAVAAQRTIDGIDQAAPTQDMVNAAPAPQAAPPVRHVYLAPSDSMRMRHELDVINADRLQRGLPGVGAGIALQRAPHETDPMLRRERMRFSVEGATQAELDAMRFTSASDRTDITVDTRGALAAASALARVSGGYRSKAEAGDQSTAAMLNAYLADAPDGPLRANARITNADLAAADETLAWARTVAPSSDYLRSVQQTLANPTVTHRNLALAVSAIPVAQRQKERDARQRAAQEARTAAAQEHQGPRKKLKRSVWIGTIGQYAHTTGEIESIGLHSPYENAPLDKMSYLIKMRTDGGALVKWWSEYGDGLHVGERVTVTGYVQDHEEYRGYKSTRLELTELPVLHLAS